MEMATRNIFECYFVVKGRLGWQEVKLVLSSASLVDMVSIYVLSKATESIWTPNVIALDKKVTKWPL